MKRRPARTSRRKPLGPHKTIATFKLAEKDWPPPGELEDALREAADAFVYTLRAALDLKMKGTVIADIDYAPPHAHLN